jgi:hypothetical protein
MNSPVFSKSVTRYVSSAPHPNLGFITYFLPFSAFCAISGALIPAFFQDSCTGFVAQQAAASGSDTEVYGILFKNPVSSGSIRLEHSSPASHFFASRSFTCLKLSAVDFNAVPAPISVPQQGNIPHACADKAFLQAFSASCSFRNRDFSISVPTANSAIRIFIGKEKPVIYITFCLPSFASDTRSFPNCASGVRGPFRFAQGTTLEVIK